MFIHPSEAVKLDGSVLSSKVKAKVRGKSLSPSVPLDSFDFSSILAPHLAIYRRPRRKVCPAGTVEEVGAAAE